MRKLGLARCALLPLITVAIAAPANSSHGQTLSTPESTVSDAQVKRNRQDEIASLIEAARAKARFPSVSVAVVRRQQVVFRRAFGESDVRSHTRATPDTTYRIASVNKPITATAVLQLVARGRIKLGSSIRNYVPELPKSYNAVLIRDLLRHTSGVRHYKNSAEFISTTHCGNLDAALRIFARDPLEHRPGEKITYSSWGYVLLGLAVEKVTGETYFRYVQDHILRPAGMVHTRLDSLDPSASEATGYTVLESGEIAKAPAFDSSCRIPAGGLVSTAEDIGRFAIALQSGRLLPRAWVRRMETSEVTPQIIARTLNGMEVPPGFHPPGMGYGFATEVLNGQRRAYHGGNQPGGTAMLYIIPQRGEAVAVLTNLDGQGDAVTDLARKIAEVEAR